VRRVQSSTLHTISTVVWKYSLQDTKIMKRGLSSTLQTNCTVVWKYSLQDKITTVRRVHLPLCIHPAQLHSSLKIRSPRKNNCEQSPTSTLHTPCTVVWKYGLQDKITVRRVQRQLCTHSSQLFENSVSRLKIRSPRHNICERCPSPALHTLSTVV